MTLSALNVSVTQSFTSSLCSVPAAINCANISWIMAWKPRYTIPFLLINSKGIKNGINCRFLSQNVSIVRN